jgi:hypothetical protein
MMEIQDKRQKRWESQTFMAMLATFLQQRRWASKGLRSMPNMRFAGLPLKFKDPETRSDEVKASKRAKRQARRRLINRRGWA